MSISSTRAFVFSLRSTMQLFLRGTQVRRQIVGGLDAAVEIIDRQPLVVAVDARNFPLAENHGHETVRGYALSAEHARIGAAGRHPRHYDCVFEISRDHALDRVPCLARSRRRRSVVGP